MADLICKWEHQNFFFKNFSSQRTCASNSTALSLTQPKIYALKIMATYVHVAHCANAYAKKKEKNSNIS